MKKDYKFPHTISSFYDLITQDYYYIDKTPYLEKLEALSDKYLFYLRPRRFGKSLFTSLLRYYYGVEHKDKFQDLFGRFYIGQNPTPLVNSYLILNLEFTKISTTSFDATFNGFLTRVKSGVDAFLVQYKDYFSAQDRKVLQNMTFPADIMEWLIYLMMEKAPGKKMYIIVDEYDHFANELIAFDLMNFKKIISKNGFVRKFYEAIKEGTKESVVDRFFATGITPITLDSMTSGFNIGYDLSLDLEFATMMGFTEAEVDEILGIVKQSHPIEEAQVKPELKRWYDGYNFNREVIEWLYNPAMLMHFATYYKRFGKFPKTMLDKNIASDYHKIRRLLTVEKPKQNYDTLSLLMEQGTIIGRITEEFSFEKYFSEDDFLSLLFYNGFLTIQDAWTTEVTFKIPNYVIERLYFSYFLDLLKERESIQMNTSKIRAAVREMALKGHPEAFFKEVEHILHQLAVRDFQNFSEKYLKLLIMSTMILTNAYYIESERETPDGFLDLSFTRQPSVPVNHEYLFELKYLKKEKEKQLKTQQQKASKQLAAYIASSSKFNNMKTLQGWTVVAVKDQLFLERVH